MKELDEVTPYFLVQCACEFKGITNEELKSSTRKRHLVVARVLVAYMLLYLGYGTEFIGSAVNRDHASVTHYKKIIISQMDIMINSEIKNFRIFLLGKDVRLPTERQFLDAVKRKEKKEYFKTLGIKTFI